MSGGVGEQTSSPRSDHAGSPPTQARRGRFGLDYIGIGGWSPKRMSCALGRRGPGAGKGTRLRRRSVFGDRRPGSGRTVVPHMKIHG